MRGSGQHRLTGASTGVLTAITVLPALPLTLARVLSGRTHIHSCSLLNQLLAAPRWKPKTPQPTCCSLGLTCFSFTQFPLSRAPTLLL